MAIADNPLQWYATDNLSIYDGKAMGILISGDVYNRFLSIRSNKFFYALVSGYPGSVVWTVIWEPSSGGSAPQHWMGGPLAAGQYPTEPNGNEPNLYVPSNADALCVGNLYYAGTVRLRATAGGVSVPGELVLVIEGADFYKNVTLSHSDGGGPPPTEFFWTQHRNTYEVP